MKLVTTARMRAIEEQSVERGVPLDTLMQRAGSALADVAAQAASEGTILILVGPGNNGGDGLVAAQRLRERGREVSVYAFHRSEPMGFEGSMETAEDDRGLSRLTALVDGAAVVVDALLGIGQNRPVEGLLGQVVDTVNRLAQDTIRIAADIPTGINADTGAVLGTAFRSSITLCMGMAKVGAVTSPGAAYAGEVRVADVGFPAGLDADVHLTMPDVSDIAAILPERRPDSNKGTYGRILVVGGSADFMGAPGLSSLAALRIGAGLVQVASIDEVVDSVGSHMLEPIYARLPAEDGKIARRAHGLIAALLQHASALVAGPGLGSSDDTRGLVDDLLDTLSEEHAPPAVIDADGLNALARIDDWWKGSGRLVLTPHPGEMSRLTGMSIQEIQSDRIGVAREFAGRWNVVVVLKGARTVVAAPDGRASINPTGGPNLATGGTGDVLSGMIGGLLAQGLGRFDAAVAGTYLHGLAGDLLAARLGDAGTLAGELPAEIPHARMHVLKQRGVTAT